mmetsp:Transcript_56422/g.112106  ORF Transcript_56422/g.112106 Transcript_56422/m.112106 type:complete len:92 (-) Transcript_56422:1350-1625(-)
MPPLVTKMSPNTQDTRHRIPDNAGLGIFPAMPESWITVMTDSTTANWESMPRQRSMMKNKIAQKNGSGIRDIAIGKAMKASPEPDSPMSFN